MAYVAFSEKNLTCRIVLRNHENTVWCHNAVQYHMILHVAQQWLKQSICQTNAHKKTPHSTSLFQASYGVSYVRILEKIDCVIMAPHCMFAFSIISQAWDVAGCWNSFSQMTRTHLFCMINSMAVDELARSQGISSHGMDLPVVVRKYCSFSIKRVNWSVIWKSVGQ